MEIPVSLFLEEVDTIKNHILDNVGSYVTKMSNAYDLNYIVSLFNTLELLYNKEAEKEGVESKSRDWFYNQTVETMKLKTKEYDLPEDRYLAFKEGAELSGIKDWSVVLEVNSYRRKHTTWCNGFLNNRRLGSTKAIMEHFGDDLCYAIILYVWDIYND